MKRIKVIDAHAAGEPLRAIISGMPELKGRSIREKITDMKENYDDYRKMILHEPRGHADMFGAILLPSDIADFGVIFCDNDGYLDMCGHGIIALSAIILELCKKKIAGQKAIIISFETPAGVVKSVSLISQKRIVKTYVSNVTSFLFKKNIPLNIPDCGEILVDITYGGNFFAEINIQRYIGIPLVPKNIPSLISLGMKIKNSINRDYRIIHPFSNIESSIQLVKFYEKKSPRFFKNLVIFGNGQFDRSPCGTGTSALIAKLVAQKELNVNE